MGVHLKMFEGQKYKTIKKINNGQISKARAEVELALSRRQINRLIRVYQTEGKSGFRHGKQNRKPSTGLTPETKKKIITLYNKKYEAFNLTHFTEKLVEVENIQVSYTTVRNLLYEKNLLSPRAFRQTKRKKHKELQEKEQHKQVLTKKECQVLNELDYVDTLKAHPSRSRKKYFGEQLQMDASSHDWFKNGSYAHLHAAIDDATGIIVGARFDKEETLDAYYEVTEQFLTNYGIPYEILTDNRTVFIYKQEKHPSEEKDTFTQFGYACHTLGINLRTTSIPQAKGKIERLWNTLQDRLLQEMALCSIQSIDEANLFLKHYIPTYNAKFALQLKDSKSAFEKLPKTVILDHILARFSQRIIQKGHGVKYQNKLYRLHDQNQQVLLTPKTSVMIIHTKGNELYASVDNSVFSLQEILLHEEVSKELDEPVRARKTQLVIPALSHPWKKPSYDRYLRNKKQKEAIKKGALLK
ncbi:Integrase core domain-containing protein [Carnobacterium iners]|uniref:Integrase core domain-containing protein n=2 Tax=Carnobacterium iners TaxID=1073423 RepID=A0A1X7N632_9LACT|nr:Integrase core domain-containing protein [Carnobacterium iners]